MHCRSRNESNIFFTTNLWHLAAWVPERALKPTSPALVAGLAKHEMAKTCKDADYITKTGDHASTSHEQNFGSLEGSSSMERSANAAQIIVILLHLYIRSV